MADSDKIITITPNTSVATTHPEIKFVGKDNSPMYLRVLDDNSLSFEGTEGQVFSMSPTMSSGDIFSVNDISGIQSMVVNADGNITLDAQTKSVTIKNNASATSTLILENTDAGAVDAPVLELYRNSASPANGDDLGQILWSAEKSDGSKYSITKMYGEINTIDNSDRLMINVASSGGSGLNDYEYMRFDGGVRDIIFNEGGNDIDVRMEGDSNSALFFLDASADCIGIGTTSPAETLHVVGPDSGPIAKFERSGQESIFISGNNGWGNIYTSDAVLSFGTGGDTGANAQMALNGNVLTIGDGDTQSGTDGAKLHVHDVDGYALIQATGTGTGWINAGLLLTQRQASGTRGLGMFMHDEQNDTEWFAGRAYNQDSFLIAHDSSATSHDNDLADIAGSNGSPLFTIKDNGNVGIGTTSPDYTLDVAGNIGVDNIIYHNGDGNTYLNFQDDDFRIVVGNDLAFHYDESGSSVMHLSYNGEADVNIGNGHFFFGGSQGSYDTKMGIGITAPDELLHVSGAAAGDSVSLKITNTDDTDNASVASLHLENQKGTDSNFYIEHNVYGQTVFYTGNSKNQSFTLEEDGDITVVGGLQSSSTTKGWNNWSMMRFGALDYGTAASGGAGLKALTFDDNEAGYGNIAIPTDITIRAVQFRTSGVVLSGTTAQVWRIFANGDAGTGTLTNISLNAGNFTRQNSENANSTAHYYTVTGLSASYDAGDIVSIRRESGAVDMGDVIVDIYYSHDI
jgi:hypothetical protein